jgi:hypothetical protein
MGGMSGDLFRKFSKQLLVIWLARFKIILFCSRVQRAFEYRDVVTSSEIVTNCQNENN